MRFELLYNRRNFVFSYAIVGQMRFHAKALEESPRILKKAAFSNYFLSVSTRKKKGFLALPY